MSLYGDTFDYIVIGAGASGSTIATRLAQKGYNLLLIEAGPDAPFETVFPGLLTYPINSHVDWNYTSEDNGYCYTCQNNNAVNFNTGRMLGGSAGLNYMVYSRGYPKSFERIYENTQDPIWKYEHILPYFIKAEDVSDNAIRNSKSSDLYGSQGYIGVTRDESDSADQVLEGFKQTGNKLIVDPDGNKVGFSKPLIVVANNTRQNAGPLYLYKIINNKYIAVAKNTLATKIIFNKNNTAIGVEAITNEGKKVIIYVRKEIIVSCGTIKSPQLLMLSGIGPATELKKFNISVISDLPVGKNMQDIIGVFIAHKTNKTNVNKESSSLTLPAHMFIGYSSLYSSLNLDEPPPDYIVLGYIIDNISFLGKFCAIVNNFRPEICNKLIHEADNKNVIISLLGNLYGQSRGEVTLRSTDPKDSPMVLPVGFSYNADMKILINYVNYYLQVEKSDAFKKLGTTRIDLSNPQCDSLKNNSMEYMRCKVLCLMVSLKSYIGTCALNVVTDSRMMVRGVNNLRVADASILSYQIGGLIYNTAVMIGEKASDLIIEDAGEKYNSMKHEMIRQDQIQNLPDPSILV